MATKYNPLLRLNLQIDNSADLSAAIAAMQLQLNALQEVALSLQQQKVTKCVNSSQLNSLSNNEVFEWQGETGTIDGDLFTNAFFYRVSKIAHTIPINTQYFKYTQESDIHNIGNIDYNSFKINYGSTFYVIDSIPVSYFVLYENTIGANTYQYIWPQSNEDVRPNNGDMAYNCLTGVHCSWIVDGHNYSLSDGGSIVGTGTGYFKVNSVYKVLNVATNEIYYAFVMGYNLVVFLQFDGSFDYAHLVDIQPIFMEIGTISETVTYYTNSYTPADTQQRLKNISNDNNNNIDIAADLSVSGDLTVNGTQNIVHTQEIDSENDNINLRVNNPLGLENGAESGVKVLNYDGNNTNCFLGVDNQGWARVGDEDGTLQKLATIEDNPTNGDFVCYNTSTKQLESKTLSVTSTTAAGLCPQLPDDATTTKYLREDGTWVKPPNTTYASKTAASGGTDVSLCTTGEKYTWNNKSDLAIGTTASTAAAGNHTHNLTIATDTGTNQLTLAFGTKYKLTAGGKTFIFTTPSSNAPSVTTGSGSLSSSGYAWAKFGNVATVRLAAGLSGTYTLPSGMPKPNSLLNSVTNGAHIKITQSQIIVTSGYSDGESITYICQ